MSKTNFGEWIRSTPPTNDESQEVAVKITLPVYQWLEVARLASAHSISIDRVLSATLNNGDELCDACNNLP